MDKRKKKIELRPETLNFIFNISLAILGILIFLTFFGAMKFIIVIFGDSVSMYQHAQVIENKIHSEGIPVPFPDSLFESENRAKGFRNTYDVRDYYFNLPFEEFQEIVKDKFVYSETYDCKYWTYMWTAYWKYNKDKYNWGMKYISTDNHLFAIVYNETSYCTLDQDVVICQTLN